MARRKTTDPGYPIAAELSQRDIALGIDKLQRRIREVESLDPSQIRHDDPSVETAQLNVQETVREIFGTNSVEHRAVQEHDIVGGPYYVGMTDDYLQGQFREGVPKTVKRLEGLIERLKEKQHYLEAESTVTGVPTLDGLALHDRIAAVAMDLYRDGHYANAVFDASKALVNYVKEKSGRHDLDGAPLMRTVFSKGKPILTVNSLTSQSDQDEQEGILHLFEGAVLAIRNPRGHGFYADSPDRAREYLLLLSMLAKLVDDSKKVAVKP